MGESGPIASDSRRARRLILIWSWPSTLRVAWEVCSATSKMNLHQLIASLQQMGGGVRVGLVAYKDVCDREMIRPLPLTALDPQGCRHPERLHLWAPGWGAGCDWPEKMDAALDAATTMGVAGRYTVFDRCHCRRASGILRMKARRLRLLQPSGT